ncbi:MAG TPA: hypothetical protein VMR16_01535 [Candidatus Saccharimonadales bacterium]|nr:hypothetical protein [Candidatus Saccharimonadales bacterium]
MMKKIISEKKSNNKPTVIFSDERGIRDLILEMGRLNKEIDPRAILKDTGEILNNYYPSKGKKREELFEKLNNKFSQLAPILTLDTHYLLATNPYKNEYKTFAIELANQLVMEYDCKSPSEKMLAETAAWAYCRMLEYSRTLSGMLGIEYLSSEKNGYYSMISKEVDRANRQYLAAINYLRYIKQPKVNVTFKTQNAFVAQNQQINAPGKAQDQNNAKQ